MVDVVFEHDIDMLIKKSISSFARACTKFSAFFFCKNSHMTELLSAGQTPDKMRLPMLTGTRDRLKRGRVATLPSYCERVMRHNPCALQVSPQTICCPQYSTPSVYKYIDMIFDATLLLPVVEFADQDRAASAQV